MTNKKILATNMMYQVATYLSDFLYKEDKTMVHLAIESKFRWMTWNRFFGRLNDTEYEDQLNPTLPFPDYFIPFWD